MCIYEANSLQINYIENLINKKKMDVNYVYK